MNTFSEITNRNAVYVLAGVMSAASCAAAQIAPPSGSSAHAVEVLGATSPAEPASASSIVREIDDLHLGARWLLLHEFGNAGPGRLVLAAKSRSESRLIANQTSVGPMGSIPVPVIHAGDPLVIEEHTAIADARLEAVAMGPAAIGGLFKARLKIGYKIVSVVCLGSGRGLLSKEQEVSR
jgi:hypothetical protein